MTAIAQVTIKNFLFDLNLFANFLLHISLFQSRKYRMVLTVAVAMS
jgi:hypothetical protein